MINSISNTQIPELTSGNEYWEHIPYPYLPTRPDLSSLLAVYYSDYDEHSWALSWVMRYCW